MMIFRCHLLTGKLGPGDMCGDCIYFFFSVTFDDTLDGVVCIFANQQVGM